MKLYTRQGDDGTTGLFGGARVSKDCTRVAAYGDVDETNAALGLVIAQADDAGLVERLTKIQGDLFVIGAKLASREDSPSLPTMAEEDVARLEGWIDEVDEVVAPLKTFVLPGGCVTAAGLHHARTVCRRAERSVTTLAHAEHIDARNLVYLNRLSDLLFALARLANHRAGIADVPWVPE